MSQHAEAMIAKLTTWYKHAKSGWSYPLERSDAEAVVADFTALTQRAEAAEQSLLKWRIAFQSVTPGGSEFQTPDEVLAWARRLKDEIHRAKIDRELSRRAAEAAEREVARMREALRLFANAFANFQAQADIIAGQHVVISEHAAITTTLPARYFLTALTLSPASPEEGDHAE